ncbi:hypothetical protein BSKO_10169 [Bryopsis sp. KO-2023]|nr:hypothetical protein BSKO_10169 [Bryopsis sp. KO-2023]
MQWDASVLRQLVANSLGPRSIVHSEMPISPIHEIDMTGCHLRGISPLKLLELVECCPNLEAMKLSGLVSSLTGTDLYFHIKDFLYITEVVCLSAGRLKCLEIDVRVESTWSMYDQAKRLDPNSWDQLLEWLIWRDLVVDVKRLEVINMPHYMWEDIEGIGVFLIEEPSVAEESLEILVEALGINESVNRVVFKLEDEELGGNSTVYLNRVDGALCIDQSPVAEAAKETSIGVPVERLGNDVEPDELSTNPTLLSRLKKLGLKTIRSTPPSS